MNISSTLAALLADLRQHPHFPELLRAVEAPQLPRFKTSEAAEPEKAQAKWIYTSGKLDQHEAWLGMLTGQPRRTNE